MENSLSGKKYKLKIVASNKSGTAETVLEWEDPNPGHTWSQIDTFPAACGGNDFVKGIAADGNFICSDAGFSASCSLDCKSGTSVTATRSSAVSDCTSLAGYEFVSGACNFSTKDDIVGIGATGAFGSEEWTVYT